MKKGMIRTMVMAALVSVAFASCVKKDPPVTPDPNGPGTVDGTGKVKLEFANKVGSSNLILSNAGSLSKMSYVNTNGDTFTVSLFRYYVSNIKLNGTKGTYTETDSYHLLDHADPTNMNFDLSNVPYDTYTSVTLMIGVDSLRNVSGAQTGALDPIKDMFWTWSTGYIMLKLEGTSPKSRASNNAIAFHAGGFSGPYAAQRTITLTLPNSITVNADGENHVHIDADVLALFRSPNTINFATQYAISAPGKETKNIADNYANMLSVSYAGL